MDDPRVAVAQLRMEIDAIDEKIGTLLALRFEKTDALGICKAMVGEAPMDPKRQLQRTRFLHDMADRLQLPVGLVLGLFDRIKDEVVSRHRAAGCVDGASASDI